MHNSNRGVIENLILTVFILNTSNISMSCIFINVTERLQRLLKYILNPQSNILETIHHFDFKIFYFSFFVSLYFLFGWYVLWLLVLIKHPSNKKNIIFIEKARSNHNIIFVSVLILCLDCHKIKIYPSVHVYGRL